MINATIFLHMNSFLLFNIGEEPCRELRPLVLLPPDANEDPDYQSDLPDLEHAMLSGLNCVILILCHVHYLNLFFCHNCIVSPLSTPGLLKIITVNFVVVSAEKRN